MRPPLDHVELAADVLDARHRSNATMVTCAVGIVIYAILAMAGAWQLGVLKDRIEALEEQACPPR